MPLLSTVGQPVSGIVEKEIARREQRMKEASILLTEGGLLYDKGEYAQAASTYRQAWDILPDSPMSAELRLQARDSYSRAAVAYAAKLADSGRYPEARSMLKTVLAADFDPDNREAKKLEKRLDDPDRYEPALSPQHVDNVAKVEKLLRLGIGYTSLGDYNKAVTSFEEVLRIDPYNSAARRGMERVEQLKEQYYDAARDHFRARKLAELDEKWEDDVPVDLTALFGASGAHLGTIGGVKDTVLNRMRALSIPIVDLQGASLEEVVEYLRIRTRELDPQKRGVDFVLKVSPEIAARPVTLSMVGAPVEEVLRYATEMTGTVYRVDEFAVTITSRAEKSTTLISKSYRVPPGFLQNAPANAPPGAGTPAPDPFAATPTTPSTGLTIRRLTAREFLEGRGVAFPDGATAAYVPSTNMLLVKNTAEALSLVDTLVEEAANVAPKQVHIQVRLIEVNQNDLKELGFDWLMGQFNVPGSSKIFAGGGTEGNQRSADFTVDDFPIAPPGGPPVGVNPVTAGLRSTGPILGQPSIDGLIGSVVVPSIDSRSPGAFTLSGVFTDPQFQVVMRALSQSKGIDLMSSPSVVTKSGQRASISLAREFIYPTEFDPPQVPQQVGGPINNGNVVVFTEPPEVVPIPPATPTAFEMRNVGITLEVEPVIGENNRIVDLNLVPASTEFEGFIDYGTDIPILNRRTGTTIIQQNDILQPIFRSNKVVTNVSVWDGQTVVLGGVMYEKRTDLKDKVPIFGDLPIVGRTFQSRVSKVEKKNVIFFVTVKVVDPAGHRVNQAAEGVGAAAAAAQ